MHVAQLILVEADTLDDAMSDIQVKLEDNPSWSDHHSAYYGAGDTFAGGWEGEWFGESNTRDAICYADDPALAENVLFERISSRKIEIDQLRERVLKSGYDPLKVEYDPEVPGWNMDAFALQRLVSLLENDWNSDSAFYDLHDWSASLSGFRSRVAVAPEKQFLVAVDFHF